MITRLGEALQLPLATQNQLMTHAGFAPVFKESDWSSDEMQPIRNAIERMLKNHDPFPAFAVDRYWSILDLNHCAEKLFGMLGLGKGGSLLDLVTSDVAPSVIENWEEVAAHAAQRLRTESAIQGGVKLLDEAVETLARSAASYIDSPMPVIPTVYRFGDTRLSLFATIAQFGTPHDISLDDLKVELFFPADTETEQFLKNFAGANHSALA